MHIELTSLELVLVNRKKKTFSFTYLGCLIYIGKKKLCYFMVAKIIKRLDAWQDNFLSCVVDMC